MPGSCSTTVTTTLPQLLQNVSTGYGAATMRTADGRARVSPGIIDESSDWPECQTEHNAHAILST